MNKKYLILILILIFISLFPIILAYVWIKSSQGVDITNNPSPTPWVKFWPDTYKPMWEHTYMENTVTGQKVVSGEAEFDHVWSTKGTDENGAYIEWNYAFSKNLPTGYYMFYTKVNDSYGNELPYSLSIMIDVTPPTIDAIELIENGFLSNDNIIEKDSDFAVRVIARDDDGIIDTEVMGVNISINNGVSQPMVHEGGGVYSINLDLLEWEYTVRFYSYDNLTNLNDSVVYEFNISDTIPPPAPIIYDLPLETEESTINVIGSAGESDVTVWVGAAKPKRMPNESYRRPEHTNYSSNLKGRVTVSQHVNDELIVPDKARDFCSFMEVGNFVDFYGSNLPYLGRYKIVTKENGSMHTCIITLSPDITENMAGRELLIYNTKYPTGWFNISINLIPETENDIVAWVVDSSGNEGDQTIAGPVYFHINPPVLYFVLSVTNESEINVSGHSKPLDNIIIYYSGEGQTLEKPTQSNNYGEFSGVINLFEKENIVYAVIVNDQNVPITSKSNELIVYYDNKGPNITITEPGLATNSLNFLVRASLKDYSEITNVRLLINDTPLYGYSETHYEKEVEFLNGVTLSDNGTYLINITAEDRFGNVNSVVKNFILDTSMPDPAIFNLDGEIINDSSPVLNFTFSQKVIVHALNGVSYVSSSTDDNMTFLFITNNLGDGIYEIEIMASALEGGATGAYSFSFTVDTTKPHITIEDIQLITVNYRNFYARVSGECADTNLEGLELYVDGSIGDLSPECISGRYTADNVVLGEGRSHSVTVKARDLAGNSDYEIWVVDTGVPDINITEIIGNGIQNEPYRTNSDKVTIRGDYMDENFDGISVLLNNNLIQSPQLYARPTGQNKGEFEVNITLISAAGQEFINNITIVAKDTSGFEGKANVIIIKDLEGPRILEFEPGTYTTSDKWPTISITTNEKAEQCWINYTTKATSTIAKQEFGYIDDMHFSTKLIDVIDYNNDGSSKTQNIKIYCKDIFANFAYHNIQFTVDLNKPRIDDFSLYYNVPDGILLLSSADYEKEYAITKFFMYEATATNVLLRATTNEDTRCSYSGSSSGQFKNYDSYLINHETNNILIYGGNKYQFNILCEDKAGNTTNVKTIKIQANSSFEAGKPIINPTYPPLNQVPVIGSLSIRFNGSVISPLGYSIIESSLEINNQIYNLGVSAAGGSYSVEVTLPSDGEYTYNISATSSNNKERAETGGIRVDTTPPGDPGIVIG